MAGRTNKARRKPVVLGAALSFAATIATWFVVRAILEVASPLGAKLRRPRRRGPQPAALATGAADRVGG